MLIEMLHAVAKRSSCLRLQVGALIVRDGRVLSIGYNGTPAGKPHCTTETCNAEKPCTSTLHAEANAIAYAARHGIALEGTWLYCTYSPCLSCAKLILSAGITLLAFENLYRDEDPLAFLYYDITYHNRVTIQQLTTKGTRVEFYAS